MVEEIWGTVCLRESPWSSVCTVTFILPATPNKHPPQFTLDCSHLKHRTAPFLFCCPQSIQLSIKTDFKYRINQILELILFCGEMSSTFFPKQLYIFPFLLWETFKNAQVAVSLLVYYLLAALGAEQLEGELLKHHHIIGAFLQGGCI